VVTKPFHFEGTARMRSAEIGIQELQKFVDTLIVIPNQNLFRIANEKTTFADAFKMADDVLHAGVRGVTDLMVMPGLINLDFADIRTVMSEMGKAMMGTGEAAGEKRAIDAAEAAISNPLLDDVSMKGARGVLINITGGLDMTLFEVDEAANRIRDEVDPDASIIFGATFDEKLQGRMRVSVVATGIDAAMAEKPKTLISLVSDRDRIAAAAAGEPPRDPVAAPAMAEPFPMPMRAAAGGGYAEPMALPLGPLAEPAAQPSAQVAGHAQPIAGPAAVHAVAAAQPSLEHGLEHAPEALIAERQATAPLAAAGEGQALAARAGGALGRIRGLNLIQRVTGVGRARATEAEAAQSAGRAAPQPPARAPRAGAARAEPPAEATQPHPAVPAAQPPAPGTSQARLGALDPADRSAPSVADEDLLDIPAFLRRQAN